MHQPRSRGNAASIVPPVATPIAIFVAGTVTDADTAFAVLVRRGCPSEARCARPCRGGGG
jgi:hypothetical protein